METKIEAVAKAIWDAKVEDDDSPKWDELDEHMDAGLKHELREMAKAAIKVCDESNQATAYRKRAWKDVFWFNTVCQTCGVVNFKAEDSSKGWMFYATPGQSVLYTCGNCPGLPGAEKAYEQ